MQKKTQERIFTLVCLALLTAMQIVFARFLVIPITSSLRFSLSFIPVVIAARCFGPLGSMVVYGLGDLIGAIAIPTTGAYMPGFTLTSVVSGLIFGLFLSKKASLPRITLSVLCSQIVCSLLMNSFWISFYYGSDFKALLLSRSVQCLVTGAVQIVFMALFLERIYKVVKLPVRKSYNS